MQKGTPNISRWIKLIQRLIWKLETEGTGTNLLPTTFNPMVDMEAGDSRRWNKSAPNYMLKLLPTIQSLFKIT